MIKAMFAGLLSIFSSNVSGVLSEPEFVDLFVEQAKKMYPNLNFKSRDGLEFILISEDKRESKVHLGNAYNTYRVAPEDVDEIINQYFKGIVEPFVTEELKKAPTVEKVFPAIKDNLYLENFERLRQEGKDIDVIYERLNEELLIFYVLDSDTHVITITSENLQEMELNEGQLLELATTNLGNYLPELKLEGDPSELSIVVADGHYESSLILFDDIWTKDNFPVNGDIVVFIPTRDLVMVTGSGESEGLKRAREIMDNPENHWSHIVSDKSFVRKKGKWEVFDK